MDTPIINFWGMCQPQYAQINQLKLLCFQKKKQTSTYKEKFVILQAYK